MRGIELSEEDLEDVLHHGDLTEKTKGVGDIVKWDLNFLTSNI